MSAAGSAEPPAPPVPKAPVRYLDGIAQIAARYDGIVLDQWGVLHNGTNPYPGAIDCLERLYAGGKRVVILSNSGKPGADNERLVVQMGFDRTLFDSVVSAGDDARAALADRGDPFHRDLAGRCHVLARDADLELAHWYGVEPARDVDDAGFLLVVSIDSPRQSVAGWEATLRRAAARGLPMLCANPDFARTAADGSLHEAPGLVARRYRELGGTVRLHGKPDAGIYRGCLRRLRCSRERVVAIGDSLEHDVLGARGAGIASVLVAAGVHREALGVTPVAAPDPRRCEALFARLGVAPDFVVAQFRW